jgi:hypothetical protein
LKGGCCIAATEVVPAGDALGFGPGEHDLVEFRRHRRGDRVRRPRNVKGSGDQRSHEVELLADKEIRLPGSRVIRMAVLSAPGSRPASSAARRATDHQWSTTASGSPSNASQPTPLRPTLRIRGLAGTADPDGRPARLHRAQVGVDRRQ